MKNRKEIIGLSEARGYYNLLPDEDKKKIPSSLVFQMVNYSDEKVIEKIKSFEDIKKENISYEGAKNIAYMSLFI